MAAPTIPAANTSATNNQGGQTPFTPPWYNFLAGLLSFITTGPLGPIALVGVTDGSVAAAGNVGEYLSSIKTVNAGVSVATVTSTTITSLTLTAGDWDLWAECAFGTSAGGTFQEYNAAALWTTAANAFPATTAYPADGVAFCQFESPATAGFNTGPTLTLGPMVINITTSATYFLSGYSEFSGGGTIKIGGAIRARRRR